MNGSEIIEDLEDDQHSDCRDEEFKPLFNDTDMKSDFDGF